MSSLSLDIDVPEKKIIGDLIGGLSIAPYGLFLLISAYAFFRGWLNWETNGGIPFLGGVIAWLFDKLIRWIYHKKHGFSFTKVTSKRDRELPSAAPFFIFLVFIASLLAVWYVDYKTQFPIRLAPILLGLLVGYRGIIWLRKGCSIYGQLHIFFAAVLIAFSLVPWIFHLSAHDKFFGPEGIYELTMVGSIIILISIMEHIIFLRTRNSGLNGVIEG